MGPDAIVQVVAGVMTPLISLITFFSRRTRLRSEIRENLSLLQELEKDDILREHSPAAFLLRGKITLDAARLAGQPLGTQKNPIPWGSVSFAAIASAGLSYLTYYINRNTFVWYSLIPAVPAFLLAVSTWGMFLNRETPPSEEPESSDNTSEKSIDSESHEQTAEGAQSTPDTTGDSAP